MKNHLIFTISRVVWALVLLNQAIILPNRTLLSFDVGRGVIDRIKIILLFEWHARHLLVSHNVVVFLLTILYINYLELLLTCNGTDWLADLIIHAIRMMDLYFKGFHLAVLV